MTNIFSGDYRRDNVFDIRLRAETVKQSAVGYKVVIFRTIFLVLMNGRVTLVKYSLHPV